MTLSLTTTITEAADCYDLTSIDVIRSELSVTGYTTKLQRYLSSASKAIAKQCNRIFQAEGIKDEFRYRYSGSHLASGIERLQLSRWPVVSIASVVENGTTLVQDIDFAVDVEAGQLMRITGDMPRDWCVFPVVVNFTGGFECIPDDVVDAAIKTVRARWLGKDRDVSVKEFVVPAILTESYAAGSASVGSIPPDALDLLADYRVPVIA